MYDFLKLNLKPGHEPELCHMIVDCCAQQRTYEKFLLCSENDKEKLKK